MDLIATFRPTAKTNTGGVPLIGGPAHVLHLLDRDTYDWREVGLMYRIRQQDGTETDAFADELDFLTPAPSREDFYSQMKERSMSTRDDVTLIDRAELRDKAREFLLDVVENEVAYTFEVNDNDPTTFDDFLADVITYLTRVIEGEVDDTSHIAHLRGLGAK